MIVGIGVDVCDTARFAESLRRTPAIAERLFTPEERTLTGESLAGRFAAKEAVLKVLGTGWRGGIAWTDVEVVKESSGQPRVVLTGERQRIAREQGIGRWLVSISHIETHATASAIGLRGEG